MFHSICKMYRETKEEFEKEMDKLVTTTGAKEKIEERILGPKEVRTESPNVNAVAVSENLKDETKEKNKYDRVIDMTEDDAKQSLEELP